MDRHIKPYDKEYMRMAMLKHEETFKEQVYELHRLYQIQKILMKNIQSRKYFERNEGTWNFENPAGLTHLKDAKHNKAENIDLEKPAEECNAESDSEGVIEIIDDAQIELTLGPSIYRRRKSCKMPLNSDSGGHSFSSSSTGSSQTNRTSSRIDQMLISKKSVHIAEQLRQEKLKQPPWFFQVLSLKMTQVEQS